MPVTVHFLSRLAVSTVTQTEEENLLLEGTELAAICGQVSSLLRTSIFLILARRLLARLRRGGISRFLKLENVLETPRGPTLLLDLDHATTSDAGTTALIMVQGIFFFSPRDDVTVP